MDDETLTKVFKSFQEANQLNMIQCVVNVGKDKSDAGKIFDL